MIDRIWKDVDVWKVEKIVLKANNDEFWRDQGRENGWTNYCLLPQGF